MRLSITSVLIPIAAVAKGGPLIADEPEAPDPHYGVETLEWLVEVAPRQTETLSGTVEQVYAQALQINTGFKLLPMLPQPPKETRGKIICDIFPKAHALAIQDGINYLGRVPGRPKADPGPGRCARVSCSSNSAIWWCNDDKKPQTLGGFGSIAGSAQAVLDQCSTQHSDLSGQRFEPGNWNTIVRKANC
ncbi:hypothetical protein PG996_003314 [Apiospora saccharicola]|uniref:Uncharacterized protein n=1 Tax=Apiospora saccharicola TaxID=335842 RepID=A0ABR1W0X7_9PEZI